MLMALNDHLRDELEESGQRHNETVADLLHRLQAAEREKEQLGARRENPMPTLHVSFSQHVSRLLLQYVIAEK